MEINYTQSFLEPHGLIRFLRQYWAFGVHVSSKLAMCNHGHCVFFETTIYLRAYGGVECSLS